MHSPAEAVTATPRDGIGALPKRRREPTQPIRLEHPPSSPLTIHDMTVAYQRKPVLWDVEYNAPAGKLIGIIGPNGAGKSTLIKSVLDLVPRIAGEVLIYGTPFSQCRERVAYVPQRESVDWDFPINALDVVCMGRYRRIGWIKWVGRKHKELALKALEQVGMANYANRQISQLSGGQQQRVFLARALAQEADVYFMDEPFAGVDAATEKAIVRILRELREAGRTVFVVHHDLQTVHEYFNEVILLNKRVVAAGPIDTAFTTANLRKTYGGQLNVLERAGQILAQE